MFPLKFFICNHFRICRKNFHKHSKAIEGSEIYIGGNIGDAAIGLNILKKNIKLHKKSFFLEKLFLPEPQISLGKSLNGIVDFCTDISDGLITELDAVANNSKLKANIFTTDLPISDEVKEMLEKTNFKKIWEIILTGGEDYKLLFSVKKNKKKYLKNKIRNIKKIGFFSKGKGVDVYDFNKKKIKLIKKGFCHF